MTTNHRELISIFFSLAIIILAAFVVQEFIIPLTWAAIIAMATWPLFKRWSVVLGQRDIITASTLITLFTILVALPLLWLTYKLTNEIHILTKFLIEANNNGVPPPVWLSEIPRIGEFLHHQWMQTLGEPQGVAKLLSSGTHTTIKPISDFMRKLGMQVAHRSVILGFTIVCLFFFYKDGRVLIRQVNAIGEHVMGPRWSLYVSNLPAAIIATVNGLVVVGLGVGVIMGLFYAMADVPAPAIFGVLTAILAIIPFGAPIAFAVVTLLLLIKGSMGWAIATVVVGTTVMFIADHFVRPTLIGNATKLPFLAVLFGILGGVKTLGLVGLFIGPVIMVLFVTLWHEPELFERS